MCTQDRLTVSPVCSSPSPTVWWLWEGSCALSWWLLGAAHVSPKISFLCYEWELSVHLIRTFEIFPAKYLTLYHMNTHLPLTFCTFTGLFLVVYRLWLFITWKEGRLRN